MRRLNTNIITIDKNVQGSALKPKPLKYAFLYNVTGVSYITANLYCMCLSAGFMFLQIQYRFAVIFGPISIWTMS